MGERQKTTRQRAIRAANDLGLNGGQFPDLWTARGRREPFHKLARRMVATLLAIERTRARR